ncbi:ATP-dependent DNA helicase PIF1-like [Myzus persicae]|uniref:ATP-dependent DNA helicase PIF1-like n=1 Tax=Myzus persicae TaxID=13164 RepID=UPI000B936B0D|nr:ATP-dependent DNA helicase PIF1-like [Myzus persicae]
MVAPQQWQICVVRGVHGNSGGAHGRWYDRSLDVRFAFRYAQRRFDVVHRHAVSRRIREAALIVWDEAPMSPGLQLTVVDRLLKDIMQSELPFGGKTVLFAGDFRQIPPVVRRGTRAAIDGNVNTAEIPRNMVCDIANLIDFVYPQQMSLANVNDFARKIILCPRNEDCRQVNRMVLQRLTGAARTYTAIHTVVANEIANYPTEFLNSLDPEGLLPYRLTLVVGSVVMLLRNIDPKIRM